MKILSILTTAALLGIAGVTSSHSAPVPPEAFVATTDAGVPTEHPYDRCHGRSSGTASAACGSLTGGPSGSLF